MQECVSLHAYGDKVFPTFVDRRHPYACNASTRGPSVFEQLLCGADLAKAAEVVLAHQRLRCLMHGSRIYVRTDPPRMVPSQHGLGIAACNPVGVAPLLGIKPRREIFVGYKQTSNSQILRRNGHERAPEPLWLPLQLVLIYRHAYVLAYGRHSRVRTASTG
jgi:hypothetical protein